MHAVEMVLSIIDEYFRSEKLCQTMIGQPRAVPSEEEEIEYERVDIARRTLFRNSNSLTTTAAEHR
jgi:hypothetical protein